MKSLVWFVLLAIVGVGEADHTKASGRTSHDIATQAIERALVVFQAGDEFAKRLPLRFLGGVDTHALQTLGNLAQYRDQSRYIIAFQYRQQHLLIRCAYLSGFINAINTFESLERNITGITPDACDVVSRVNGFLTQKNPQLVDKLQYGTF